MPVIKAVLREEYQSALGMEKEYEHVLSNLPKGALVKRVIRKRAYYYIMERKGKKISYKYIGKIGPEKIAEYDEIKKRRAQYRNLRSQLKVRIKFLKGVLRGKREI